MSILVRVQRPIGVERVEVTGHATIYRGTRPDDNVECLVIDTGEQAQWIPLEQIPHDANIGDWALICSANQPAPDTGLILVGSALDPAARLT